MRDMKRNQQVIYYSSLNDEATSDEWGNPQRGYTEPKEFFISVSANKGEASQQAFGTDLKYDKEMLTHDMSCPIDEYSHLWLEGKPINQKHNYKVNAVAKSLNCIRYAIERVDIS